MMRMTRMAAFVVMLLIGTMMVTAPTGVKAECDVYHTVQAGQNLYRISLRYGVSIASIAAANGISNVSLIYAGQTLYIPCSDASTGGSANATTSTVPNNNAAGGQSALDCTGFVGTSPDAFTLESSIFYWDPPSFVQPARYQVRIFNEQGANVGSYEVLYPYTTLTGDTSIAGIGEGYKFYWYVVAVTADNRLCQTPTRLALREWPKGPAPTAVPTTAPAAVKSV